MLLPSADFFQILKKIKVLLCCVINVLSLFYFGLLSYFQVKVKCHTHNWQKKSIWEAHQQHCIEVNGILLDEIHTYFFTG